MKNKFVFYISLVFVVFTSSCAKDLSADNSSAFLGTYNMSSNCWLGTRPVKIEANGTNSILLPLVLSEGTSCQKNLTIPVTVEGNTISLKTLTVTDACNNSYTETVSGTLSGNNLSLTYVVSNAAGSITCNFSGSK